MTIRLTLPPGESPVTGKQVTFIAPCKSSSLLRLEVGGSIYELVNSDNTPIQDISFVEGALVTVTLHTDTLKAYILNSASAPSSPSPSPSPSPDTPSGEVSDEQIAKAVAEYFEDHPADRPGADGKSAYEVAVENGFRGTEAEWLESLKGEDGKDGETGEQGLQGKSGDDGVSPIIKISKSGKVTTITITDAEGTKTATILDGENGSANASVKDGVTPLLQISTDGIWEVSYDNGTTWTSLEVTAAGEDGVDGDDGYTPVKGTDYFTPAEIQEIQEKILGTLPISVNGGFTDIDGLRLPTNMHMKKSGDRVNINVSLQGGLSSLSVVKLNSAGYPSTITTEGVVCNVVLEGFDDE